MPAETRRVNYPPVLFSAHRKTLLILRLCRFQCDRIQAPVKIDRYRPRRTDQPVRRPVHIDRALLIYRYPKRIHLCPRRASRKPFPLPFQSHFSAYIFHISILLLLCTIFGVCHLWHNIARIACAFQEMQQLFFRRLSLLRKLPLSMCAKALLFRSPRCHKMVSAASQPPDVRKILCLSDNAGYSSGNDRTVKKIEPSL